MYRHRVFLACFISHCYTCIKTWVESEILSSTILEKLYDFLELERYAVGYIFEIEFTAVVLQSISRWYYTGSLHHVQCVPYAEILQIFLLFCMIWNCRIQSPAVSKERDVRWCGFPYSIPISIGYLWNACIDMAFSTPSCSYCIWNRYWQNHAAFFRISYCLLDLIRLKSIVCHDQTTRYTMMQFSLIDSAMIWLRLEFEYWYGYLDTVMLILHI